MIVLCDLFVRMHKYRPTRGTAFLYPTVDHSFTMAMCLGRETYYNVVNVCTQENARSPYTVLTTTTAEMSSMESNRLTSLLGRHDWHATRYIRIPILYSIPLFHHVSKLASNPGPSSYHQWRINHRADGERARFPRAESYLFRERVPGRPQQLLLPLGPTYGRPQQLLLPLGPTYTCISHNENKDFAILMIDPTFHILTPRSANKNASVDT